MKSKIILTLGLCFAGLASVSAQTNYTFNFDVGVLADENGNAIADGMRLEFVARAVGSVDAALSSDSFLLAGEVSLGAVSFNSSIEEIPGGMSASFSFDRDALALPPESEILVRWFPYNSISALTPGVVRYGQAMGVFAPATSSTLPSGGGTVTYQFLTEAYFGDFPDSAGFANLMTQAVPEPSAYAAMAGLAALGFVVLRRRRVPQA